MSGTSDTALRRDGTRLVQEHADGWCSGIVELTGSDGPDEAGQEATGDQTAGHDEEHDHAHALAPSRPYQRINPTLRPMIVSELTGMKMAVTSGVSHPARASDSPIAL